MAIHWHSVLQRYWIPTAGCADGCISVRYARLGHSSNPRIFTRAVCLAVCGKDREDGKIPGPPSCPTPMATSLGPSILVFCKACKVRPAAA